MARSKRKPMSDINVVPYIDVMLVLLIIFMVTAPMLTQGIQVDLPKIESEDNDIQTNKEPLIVSINANGAYFLEMSSESGKAMELDKLVERAAIILKQNPTISVLVRGDEDVAYGRVVELMAELQGAGAQGVGLITEDL